MRLIKLFLSGLAGAFIYLFFFNSLLAGSRVVPQPDQGHPGNIFLAGEEIIVPVPIQRDGNWRLVDYDGIPIAEGPASRGQAGLGKLPVGYYELVSTANSGTNRIALGVLHKLRAPTPLTSPLGIDVAMAWFYPTQKMETVAKLCALAGMNRVRDRLSWPEMEPQKGHFSSANRYDASASAQSAVGLQVLQVMHISPNWANSNPKRFPLDLREVYDFERAMAQRWRGQVVAFEPWNEADIEMFGGHTGSEIATLQKAACLGLKAGNPQVTACLNVFALHRAATLEDVQQNEAWPYFDTFNLHHYEPFAAYPKLYVDFRAVSAGRPMWVTECSVPVKWNGDPHLQEPTPGDLRLQSERIAMTYALAIHEGAQAVFYFMLPHYVEGPTQFGIVRRDLTPRPAFVALAAAGRLLADAKPLGRLQTAQDSIHGYCFGVKPDGKKAEVLVIWSESDAQLELPKAPKACFDHLGRPIPVSAKTLHPGRAPIFVLLASGGEPPLVPPPRMPEWLPDKPSPVVLQALPPESSVLVNKSAYKLSSKQPTTIPVYAYNFGGGTVRGMLKVAASTDWTWAFPAEVELAPGERKELPLRLSCKGAPDSEQTIRITGAFGTAGAPVLSFRVLVCD